MTVYRHRILREREPGRHIDGMVRRYAHHDQTLPPGWTRQAWEAYLADPDGGRAAVRAHLLPPPDSTPTFIERMSWEDE